MPSLWPAGSGDWAIGAKRNSPPVPQHPWQPKTVIARPRPLRGLAGRGTVWQRKRPKRVSDSKKACCLVRLTRADSVCGSAEVLGAL